MQWLGGCLDSGGKLSAGIYSLWSVDVDILCVVLLEREVGMGWR